MFMKERKSQYLNKVFCLTISCLGTRRLPMNDVTKQVLVAVITAVILGFFGYTFVVKENQIKIAQLEKSLTKESESMAKSITEISKKLDIHYNGIKSSIGESRSTIDSLKLFVVAAHPNRDHISLTASVKLQSLNSNQFNVLATGLMYYKDNSSSNLKTINFDDKFTKLIKDKKITKTDLDSYLKVLDVEKKVP